MRFGLARLGLLVAFFAAGHGPAAAFCVAGLGDSLQCRYLAACTRKGTSAQSCDCSYKLAQQGFPPDQLPTFVETFEAYADSDHARVQLLQSRLGFAAVEFTGRLNTVMNMASARCGP